MLWSGAVRFQAYSNLSYLADFFSPACKAVFVAPSIGKRKMTEHIKALVQLIERGEGVLRNIILLDDKISEIDGTSTGVETYSQFLLRAQSIYMSEQGFKREERHVKATDILNLQFTSGMSSLGLDIAAVADREFQEPLERRKRPCFLICMQAFCFNSLGSVLTAVQKLDQQWTSQRRGDATHQQRRPALSAASLPLFWLGDGLPQLFLPWMHIRHGRRRIRSRESR